MASETTQTRRKRVRELWGKPDRTIAELLLEEGFPVNCGRTPKAPAARATHEAKRIETMRRNVSNDRDWWREQWKTRKAPSGEDLNVAREEHIASLESDLDEIHDLIDSGTTKATATAILIGEKRQTRALLAKAKGVEDVPPADPEADRPKVPFVGFILGTANVSEEMRQQLGEQGIELGE